MKRNRKNVSSDDNGSPLCPHCGKLLVQGPLGAFHCYGCRYFHDGLVSVPWVAKRLGVSVAEVFDMIKRGDLEAGEQNGGSPDRIQDLCIASDELWRFMGTFKNDRPVKWGSPLKVLKGGRTEGAPRVQRDKN